ncbi:hypothetical protein GCM10009851_15270 [Herbiconiux moechotypicola]|uniref:Uncharacterized protein n=1 Tax=Herbiconiux moechotypicola TaxID=637393 RepID=A0ABN3DHD0_9MICO
MVDVEADRGHVVAHGALGGEEVGGGGGGHRGACFRGSERMLGVERGVERVGLGAKEGGQWNSNCVARST